MDGSPQDRFAIIERLLGRPPGLIVDVGVHHGHSAAAYLEHFPDARIIAIEAEAANFAAAQALLGRDERVRLVQAAAWDEVGSVTLKVNSHDGTHSVLPIGKQRFWAGYARTVAEQAVPALTLDQLIGQDTVDLLHMDIQGAELRALEGAEVILKERRVALIYTEVQFQELYQGAPSFWTLGDYLARRGYQLWNLFDVFHHPANAAVLSWADALFVSEDYLTTPEHIPPSET